MRFHVTPAQEGHWALFRGNNPAHASLPMQIVRVDGDNLTLQYQKKDASAWARRRHMANTMLFLFPTREQLDELLTKTEQLRAQYWQELDVERTRLLKVFAERREAVYQEVLQKKPLADGVFVPGGASTPDENSAPDLEKEDTQ